MEEFRISQSYTSVNTQGVGIHGDGPYVTAFRETGLSTKCDTRVNSRVWEPDSKVVASEVGLVRVGQEGDNSKLYTGATWPPQLTGVIGNESHNKTILDRIDIREYHLPQEPSLNEVLLGDVEVVHVHGGDNPGLPSHQNPHSAGLLLSSTDGREDSDSGNPAWWRTLASVMEVELGSTVLSDIQQVSTPPPFFGCIELFAGVGSLSRSIQYEGGKVLAVCETDQKCCALLMARHPGLVVESDVREIKWDSPAWQRLRYDAENPLSTGCVLMGGPPCSPYSKAGPQLDQEDSKSDLMLYMVKAASHLSPEVVIIENVPAFQDSKTYSSLVCEFNKIGYKMIPRGPISHAHLHGPTTRTRICLYFVPVRSHESWVTCPQPPCERWTNRDPLTCQNFIFPRSAEAFSIQKQMVTTANTLSGSRQCICLGTVEWGDSVDCPVVVKGCCGKFDGSDRVWIATQDSVTIKDSIWFLSHDRKAPSRIKRSVESFRRHGQRWPVYSTEGLSLPVKASGPLPTGPVMLIQDGSHIRPISPQEAWFLQELPTEDWEFLQRNVGLITAEDHELQMYRRAGNSIPPPMAEWMVYGIGNQLTSLFHSEQTLVGCISQSPMEIGGLTLESTSIYQQSEDMGATNVVPVTVAESTMAWGGNRAASEASVSKGVADSTTSSVDLVDPAGTSQHALNSITDMADTEWIFHETADEWPESQVDSQDGKLHGVRSGISSRLLTHCHSDSRGLGRESSRVENRIGHAMTHLNHYISPLVPQMLQQERGFY